MSGWIRRLLAPPVFEEDEDKTRTALLLHIILLTLIARAVFIRVITWSQEARPSYLVPIAILLLGMMLLARRGYVRLASVTTVIAFWLSLSVIAVIDGGLHSTGFRNYFIPVLIAGLLLGRAAAVATAGLSVLAGICMWVAENNGVMPAPPTPATSPELVVTHAVSLIMAAVLVTLARRGSEEALKRARQELAERKEAESAMRESENRWRAVFDNAALGIALVDSEGHPAHSNPALQRMIGYTGDELRAMSFVEFTHPDDVALDTALANEVFTGARTHYRIEKRFLRKDGQVRWGNLTVSTIHEGSAGHQLVVGMVDDITERKRAEEALLLSESRYRKIVELAPEAIVVVDMDAGTFVDFNPQALALFELSSDQILKVGPIEMSAPVQPDGRPAAQGALEYLGRALAGETPVFEWVHRNTSGEDIPCEVRLLQLPDESRTLVRGTITDITNRKRAEKSIRESEERFRQLTDHIRDVFWMNKPDLSEVLYISPAYETVWGRTRASLHRTPRSFLDAIHPEDRTRVAGVFEGKPEQNFEIEYRVVRPDGSTRWIWDRGFPIKDHAGRVYRLAGIAEDITERKRAEEQLKDTSAQLRALMASLRSAREQEGVRIAREIHDELGSALTSLRWDLEEIERTLSETERPVFDPSLRGRIGAMFDLVNTTIDAVRRISSELRPSVLDDLGLTAAIEWHAQQFQARTGIVCRYDCLVENLDIDKEESTAIFRIFQEATTNVLRHAQATSIDVRLEEEAGQFVLSISDDGRGIAEDEKSGLRSLGLLGMRERASLLGGSVEIAGVEGKGTTVVLHIPNARLQGQNHD